MTRYFQYRSSYWLSRQTNIRFPNQTNTKIRKLGPKTTKVKVVPVFGERYIEALRAVKETIDVAENSDKIYHWLAVRALYLELKTCAKVAKEVGVSAATVRKFIERAEQYLRVQKIDFKSMSDLIAERPQGRSVRNETIYARWLVLNSHAAVAREFEVSRARVQQIVSKIKACK